MHKEHDAYIPYIRITREFGGMTALRTSEVICAVTVLYCTELGRRQKLSAHLTFPVRCCPISYHELSVEERAAIQIGHVQVLSQR